MIVGAKIVETLEDVKYVNIGDKYVIDPNFADLEPLSDEYFKKVTEISEAINKKFSKE